MKQFHLLLVPVLAVITPLAVLADPPAVPDTATGIVAHDSAPATGEHTATPGAMHQGGAKHKGHCRQKGKMGKGGSKHGGGQHGKHGGGQHGKHGGGQHAKQDEVVRRLDLIEARIAKIELMLESLMKRR